MKTNELSLSAGDFSSWLREFRNALTKQGGIEVDCDDCIGCCTSSYFVLVEPEETETLARIPREALFEAPGMPRGHSVLGYAKDGRCPMLKGARCTVYEDRPQACRIYDCRVLAAAGLSAGGEDKEVINRRVKEWTFKFPTDLDRDEHSAVRAAAAFIRGPRLLFPRGLRAQRPEPTGRPRDQGVPSFPPRAQSG